MCAVRVCSASGTSEACLGFLLAAEREREGILLRFKFELGERALVAPLLFFDAADAALGEVPSPLEAALIRSRLGARR